MRIQCYAAAVNNLKIFCISNKIQDKFVAKTIECFVVSLKQQALSHGSIQSTLSAIRHYCHTKSIPVSIDTPKLKLLMRIKRAGPAKGHRSINHVSFSHLNRICRAADSLYDAGTSRLYKALFTLAFFALLRPGEVANSSNAPERQLKRKAIRFGKNFMTVSFNSYKHSSGSATIKVYKFKDSFLCPWTNLFKYLTDTAITESSVLFLVTTMEMNDAIKDCDSLAAVKTNVTAHSFRRGGATWYSSHGMADS